MLVRFIAIALIGFSLAELALTFAIEQKVPVTVLPCLLKSLPALGGVIMLIRGRAIAEWMDNLLDN